MRVRAGVGIAVVLALAACAARAGEPGAPLPALALVPKDAVAFCHVPNLKALDKDLNRFAAETGWRFAKGANPLMDQIVERTDLQVGLDWDGPAAIAYLDPKQFPNRYTVYVLPVSDWDALLKAVQGEEMAVSLYALTGTRGPRFLLKRGRFAVVTSSVRTMDAVREGGSILDALPPETRARAAGPGPMVYVDVHRLVRAYEDDILTWMRASTGQLVASPQAAPFSDIIVSYVLGLTDLLDQVERAEAALRFEQDGLAMDLEVRFVEGASVAKFLAAQKPAPALLPPLGDTPFTSCVSLQLDPATRTEQVMRMTRFFLEKAPRPQPLRETTKKHVTEAVQALVDSLGPRMISISAPAAPALGFTSSVTVVDLKDPQEFDKAVTLVVTAWEELADELDLYMTVQPVPGGSVVADVPVQVYVPRFRFGIPPRHLAFQERLRAIYGPEGMTYRLAVIGQTAVVASGSDLTLFRSVIEHLKQGKEDVPPALARIRERLAREDNVSILASLPLFLRDALLHGGTPEDRIGTVDPGKEVAGLSLSASGVGVRVGSFWPHEQLRLAKELLDRAAPAISEGTESLFQPTPEGPPKGAGEPPLPAKPEEGAPPAPAPAPAEPPQAAPPGEGAGPGR